MPDHPQAIPAGIAANGRLMESFFKLTKTEAEVADFTVLCRRSKTLDVKLQTGGRSKAVIDIVEHGSEGIWRRGMEGLQAWSRQTPYPMKLHVAVNAYT